MVTPIQLIIMFPTIAAIKQLIALQTIKFGHMAVFSSQKPQKANLSLKHTDNSRSEGFRRKFAIDDGCSGKIFFFVSNFSCSCQKVNYHNPLVLESWKEDFSSRFLNKKCLRPWRTRFIYPLFLGCRNVPNFTHNNNMASFLKLAQIVRDLSILARFRLKIKDLGTRCAEIFFVSKSLQTI